MNTLACACQFIFVLKNCIDVLMCVVGLESFFVFSLINIYYCNFFIYAFHLDKIVCNNVIKHNYMVLYDLLNLVPV